MQKIYVIFLPMCGMGPTVPTGGCEFTLWEEEQEAPIPEVDVPDASFSSLLTVWVDSKDEERDWPKIVDERCIVDDEGTVGCKVPEEAAAAAAAIG